MVTPLTPNYTFGHDEHYTQVHESKHVPNLTEPSAGHAHSHEGHSHNMRGVFLHVMAVCTLFLFSSYFLADVLFLGHAGFGWCHHLDPPHPVLRLDGLRPHRIAVHRHPHRCERDSSRYRHRKGPHARLERKDIECAADDQRGFVSLFEMHALIY